MTDKLIHDDIRGFSPLTADDLHWFAEGTHGRIQEKLGAHLVEVGGARGASFAVWAPHAATVSVIGTFNRWEKGRHPLRPLGNSGIWTGFLPGVEKGMAYKYAIQSQVNEYETLKADPCALCHEPEPRNPSLVWPLDYTWRDAAWMESRADRQQLSSPISIYEVHLGSWMRVPEESNRWLTYREIAPKLAEYVERHGFTHVEFMPLMNHPFYGSWGYQIGGYFAPTGRYGAPEDLMFLIDTLHQRGIGVILDWVPSHFPGDEHGLALFDGAPLYENADPLQRVLPRWNSLSFDYHRPQVRSFLLSNALFWLGQYHADGLRVDAVASMLYLDFGRQPGEWVPNEFGGRENLPAISFLRQLNERVFAEFPSVQTFAEESSAWPQVSRPTYVGGLGFGFKWDMGFAHDTLDYFQKDPVHRKFHHHRLTFRGMYAFSENFVLPLSHDDVVNGKRSLLAKMPGDDWQRFSNLRLLLAYQWALPGKKLLFMGLEFAQWSEWDHETSLEWHLASDGNLHNGIQRQVGHLNWLYRHEPALHEGDTSPAGFEWVDSEDSEESTLSFLRKSQRTGEVILCAFNFTPIPRRNVRTGVPRGGLWREIFNTDSQDYGGSGQGNQGGVESVPLGWHFKPHSISLTLPPLGAVFLKSDG